MKRKVALVPREKTVIFFKTSSLTTFRVHDCPLVGNTRSRFGIFFPLYNSVTSAVISCKVSSFKPTVHDLGNSSH